MNIFIKMLDNFQDEFIVFFPYVLNFSKNIGISSLNYFKETGFEIVKKTYDLHNENIFEENIEKPIFYNSKKNNNEEEIKANNEEPKKKNYILIKNIIKLENIKETILAKKNEQTQIVKEEIEKNLEKEYGSLNINANIYIPKRKDKMMIENIPKLNFINSQNGI